ncbi:metallophosphoesterase family protein [Thalassovita taeanensis]|uniref:Serine/threonine protein phosphatase 1 n=1 Tax=Thalassovita taeanensis TaxID=657014 RepID=A0A1H9DVY4_9RHOB|nr:metallophosphoesterase family protein [Thalassovita taeanensis]SEQ17487.1 serine/threonine protein phosphatase 1 [Thalassovita taeanensis]
MPDFPLYAIGDIHGQIDMLNAAIALIQDDGGADANIVFLGDLVDRGPGSREVIDLLQQGQSAGRPWTVLSGNHDRMFADFLSSGRIDHPRILSGISWENPRLGGLETLASYGVNAIDMPVEHLWAAAQEAVPARHLAFLNNLPTYHEVEDLLFVHAGIAPGVPLQMQTAEDMMWIRGPFLTHTKPHPWLVVHGHTAVDQAEHQGNRVNLDSGAGYGRPITAAVFESGQVWTLKPGGRQALRPVV